MFAGNLGYVSVLDTVLEAAKLLQNDPRFLFLIVGEGNAKPGLLKRCHELALANVRFLPAQPKEVLPQMLGAADVSLVTLNRHLGPLNVPSKIYSIMASARPVVGAVPEDSEIARIIREAKCGIWVPPEDPQSLAEALEGISQQSELLQHYGANGRHYVEKHLDRHILTRRYHELLHRVADPRQ
jgi:colanic acid biosynthesis glycosyl transferase WcaI